MFNENNPEFSLEERLSCNPVVSVLNNSQEVLSQTPRQKLKRIVELENEVKTITDISSKYKTISIALAALSLSLFCGLVLAVMSNGVGA